MQRLSLWLFLLAVIAPQPAARFDLDTSARIVRVSDPVISPDGRSVGIVVSRANRNENRYDSELVLIDIGSRRARVLTQGRRGVSAPRWSPDGTSLAFLANVEGRAQLFVLPIDGGEARQVTTSPTGIQTYAWRPDGRAFAYAALDEPVRLEGEERFNRAFEIQHNSFLQSEAPVPSHLWVVSADGGPARRVTSGTWSLPITYPPGAPPPAPAWSPDGRSIVVERRVNAYSGDFDQSSIQVVDVETGRLRALTGRTHHEAQPQLSPDGSRVAYWYPRGGQTRNNTEIVVAPITGGEGQSVTSLLDRHILTAAWTPDGSALLLGAADGTRTGVWMQPLDGPARKLDFGNLAVASGFGALSVSMSRNGRMAFVASDARRPNELYWRASESAPPERLTDFNAAIAAMDLGRMESIEWDGPDGFRMDGVVTYPPSFKTGEKYPLVLYIHGGPRASSKEAFSPRAQLLAAQGWIVFEPNYRGSDNRGNAFMAAIWNDAGAGPGRDVMSGVEFLRRRGFIDESRMAVSGWSYGGYMTTWLLGNYPEAWKAGVAGAAVTDWMDQYNLGDANVRRGAAIGGSPYTDPQRMRAAIEQSPITYATKIKAPTLILALTGDYRVPIMQSYRLYHALRDNGVTVQFVGYPLPGHSPTDPYHQRDVDRRWVEWLRTYLGPGR
jgi:dipeptidyl aminopeptidase/acylaminoacyl peptidase